MAIEKGKPFDIHQNYKGQYNRLTKMLVCKASWNGRMIVNVGIQCETHQKAMKMMDQNVIEWCKKTPNDNQLEVLHRFHTS